MTGLLAMAGALTYAELGTLIRQSGGEQAYLREIYGELWSFQFIWFSAMVGKPASMAIVLTVIAEYWLMLGLPHHLQPLPSTLRAVMTKSLALGLLAALLLMQIFSPKSGERLQNATSGLKLILLFCISFCGAIVVVGRLLSGTIASATSTVSIPIENEGYSGNRVQAIILACYQGLWAYDGWNNLNIITGELIDPDRSLPRTIIVSIPLITVLYLAVNISYLAVLPTQTFRQSTTVAIDFAQEFFRQLMTPTAGQLAGTLFGMLVTIGTVGSCCVGLFIAGRLMHSAALKNQLPYAAYFARLEAVSLRQTVDEPQPSNQVPVRGLFFQSLLTVLFLLTGTYQSLIQLYSWMVWVFYGLSALGVILLRYREPFRSQPRPFKVLIVLVILLVFSVCKLSITA
jgi:amino acid transporter